MKVKRVLIYTGKKEWVERTLDHSIVTVDSRKLEMVHGTIELESEEVIEDE